MSMSFPLYLAMTPGEAQHHSVSRCCWMALHFSCSGPGLTNMPHTLPPDTLLMLDDLTPPIRHDPMQIVRVLAGLADLLHPKALLLDFERPDCQENAKIAEAITQNLSCPVLVSDLYAAPLSCPVFLSAPALHRPLQEQLEVWQGREVWLEAAMNGEELVLTDRGCRITPCGQVPASDGFVCDTLHCRYQVRVHRDSAVFTLWRDRESLHELLTEAEALGVVGAVGLYQELAAKKSPIKNLGDFSLFTGR